MTKSILPTNFQAEACVISSILQHPEIYDEVSQLLKPTDFYNTAYSHIYDALRQLAHKAAPIDEITVLEQLRESGTEQQVGGLQAIYDLREVAGSMLSASYAATKLVECTKRRSLIRACRVAIEQAAEQREEPESIASRLDTVLLTLADEQASDFNLKNCIATATDQLTTRGTECVIPHGIPSYDATIADGGLKAGQMHAIGGRPGRGKTTFALNIAGRAMTAGHGVGVISLEMSAVELMKKMICMGAGVNFEKFKDSLHTEAEQASLDSTTKRIQGWNFHISDNAYMTVDDILARARVWKRKHDIKLLIIDYLQLIKAGEGSVREQQVAEMSRKIKLMAKTLQIPVIILAQLSRQCEQEDRAPKLTDLRESGAIEQDSDICTFLYNKREDLNADGRADVLRWVRPKQRNGAPNCYGTFKFNGARGVISDL